MRVSYIAFQNGSLYVESISIKTPKDSSYNACGIMVWIPIKKRKVMTKTKNKITQQNKIKADVRNSTRHHQCDPESCSPES